jgi:hypothetical protein
MPHRGLTILANSELITRLRYRLGHSLQCNFSHIVRILSVKFMVFIFKTLQKKISALFKFSSVFSFLNFSVNWALAFLLYERALEINQRCKASTRINKTANGWSLMSNMRLLPWGWATLYFAKTCIYSLAFVEISWLFSQIGFLFTLHRQVILTSHRVTMFNLFLRYHVVIFINSVNSINLVTVRGSLPAEFKW